MKKVLQFFQRYVLVAVAICFLGSFLIPATVSADLFDGSRQAACDATASSSGQACDPKTDGGKANNLLGTAINLFSIVVSIIAVIMIIIGGVRYVTSQGESNAINGAKNTIIYAVVGLVIVAAAQLIVRFVVNRVG